MSVLPCSMCTRWTDDVDLRIMEFSHSYLVLNRDQFFPGYCLLFTREHVTELFHLERQVRQELMEEVCRVAAVLAPLFRADKINYELLGNMVPHIHWHLVPRRGDDPLWPRPIWAEPHRELLLTPEAYRERTAAIRQALEAA
ncbi:HIT family protein [Trichlorobacter ammonificans]|uniref:Histidine triad (HIT) protein n=1 Tax=Trichlorobacter ammonificans TaxID=2916410 RepID=A0ABM9D4Q8_9BACT|nr:HIT family protein [Trichlorobacter ammonificans]CAH2030239.1 Histidine triad (HIT) protein [Trichlorobacter ammonificans]